VIITGEVSRYVGGSKRGHNPYTRERDRHTHTYIEIVKVVQKKRKLAQVGYELGIFLAVITLQAGFGIYCTALLYSLGSSPVWPAHWGPFAFSYLH
jgi:hypothetical protein